MPFIVAYGCSSNVKLSMKNEFSGDSTLLSSGLINDKNQKVGEWNYYYGSGVLKLKGVYIDGKRSGQWERYDESGNLIYKVTYRNDSLTGPYFCFSNGRLIEKGTLESGIYKGWLFEFQYSSENRLVDTIILPASPQTHFLILD